MSNLCSVMLVTLLLPWMTTGASAQSAALEAHKLSERLTSIQISKVSVIHVPSDLETRIRINPDTLRHLSWITLSFDRPGEHGLLQALKAALQETKVGKFAPEREVRWGLLLVDSSGKERAAVFLDSTGQYAQVGHSCMHVQGRTLAWIKDNIRYALR